MYSVVNLRKLSIDVKSMYCSAGTPSKQLHPHRLAVYFMVIPAITNYYPFSVLIYCQVLALGRLFHSVNSQQDRETALRQALVFYEGGLSALNLRNYQFSEKYLCVEMSCLPSERVSRKFTITHATPWKLCTS
jgi:hypothetical protein